MILALSLGRCSQRLCRLDDCPLASTVCCSLVLDLVLGSGVGVWCWGLVLGSGVLRLYQAERVSSRIRQHCAEDAVGAAGVIEDTV